jgi:O-antigen/teichoic acid export membrane protein
MTPAPGGRLRGVTGWASLALGSAVSRGLAFVASVIVARALGPSGFGDFSIFFALMVAFSISTQFVDVTLVRHATTPGASPRASLRAALVVKIALVVLFGALSYPLALVLATLVFDRPTLTAPIVIAIVAGLFVSLVSLRASTFLAESRYVAYTVVGSVFYVLAVAALLPIWLGNFHLDTWTVYWVFLGAAAAAGVPALVTLVMDARPLRVERAVFDQVVRFASWLFAANLLGIAIQRLDLIVLARYVDSAEVGLYGAAVRITVVVSLLIGALSGFLLPRVGGIRASRAALRAHLREIQFFSLFLALAIFATWLATPQLVRALFGPEYADATSLARILLLGTLLLSISAPLGQLLLAADVPRGVFFLALTRLLSILSLTLLLAPQSGATGVAWAYVSSEAIALVYVVVAATLIWRRSPNPPAT